MKVLTSFKHGLGDAVQFTIVLQHIKKYRPQWCVDVLSPYGKHSCFYGLCDRSLIMYQDNPNRSNYQQSITVRWSESWSRTSAGIPGTKPAIALAHEFHIELDPHLFYYKINVPPREKMLVHKYISQLPENKGIVILHYEGNSSPWQKNLPHNTVRYLAKHFMGLGYVLVILDWDNRSPLPAESDRIFCPEKNNALWDGHDTGNAATIVALIDRAKLFIGIDSGPLHCAGATATPSIGIWTRNHPIHYYDLADNVTHLLPHNARSRIYGRRVELQSYFEDHYRHAYYNDNTLTDQIMATACELLERPRPSFPITDTIVFDEPWKRRIQYIQPKQYWVVGATPDHTRTFP